MSESLERIEYVFAEALARTPTERRKFVAEMCGQDGELLAEVEALLRAEAEGELRRSSPAGAVSAGPPLPPRELADQAVGTRIGPYKLLQKLGEGGCGAVYLAEQSEPIRRRVALKIIKLGMDTREVIARFEAERQTLALMEHSHIARVFECGATAAGRPYFVMELVQGVSITRFCEERRLTLARRLELFVPVCRAIQHAHEKGVVHRDIKPSNILVAVSDGAPLPKVIDFGVAKATEARISDKTLFTSHEQFIGTPHYMSPEQAALGSGEVDARTDIYALGVLLYELLTGFTPFDHGSRRDAGFEEMRRRAREDEAPAPSECVAALDGNTLAAIARSRDVEPPKLIGALRGDLDWIVMRCLEKDPALRYSTAVGLAEEVGRFLRHELVLAGAPRLRLRVRRLARRHRRAVQIAGAVAAVTLAGAGGWLWTQARRPAGLAASVEPVVSPRSIAVLPFSNLSPDPANAFFADGVREDLINNLAKIHDLKVISRTSVMASRAGPRNLRAIAEDLGVANVLEGSVRRSGDEVRVTAQLFDAFTEHPIWADAYDRKLTDIFSIQSELATRIAGALEASLTTDERRLIDRHPTTDPAAYDLYLRARALDDQLSSEATLDQYEPVFALYNQAVSLDPNFALAYVQIAALDLKLYWYASLDMSKSRLALAQAATAAAVRLAPDEPETKFALGEMDYHVALNWRKALAEFRAAEAQMPNDDQAIFAVGFTQRRLGQWNEAAQQFARAAARNPLSLSESFTTLETLSWLRRYPQARAAARGYLVRFPANRILAEFLRDTQYELDGDRHEFLQGREALPRDPGDPEGLFNRFEGAVERGDWSSAEEALSDPRFPRWPDGPQTLPHPPVLYRSMVAYLRGDREAARGLADLAIAYFRENSWLPRQEPWVALKMAEADAYAGRSDQAVREARSAWAAVAGRDAVDATNMRISLGKIYLIAGRRDEALEVLRQAMQQPCDWGPQKIRHDPFWSGLADDPRFEPILRSATAL